jgi:hypothetical protein
MFIANPIYDTAFKRLMENDRISLEPSVQERTRLGKLLSIFEQSNFISKNRTMNEFALEVKDPEIEDMLSVLHYVVVDEKTRKELDDELYYQHYVEQTFGEDRQKLAEQIEENKKQKEEMQRQKEEIASLKKQLESAGRL